MSNIEIIIIILVLGIFSLLFFNLGIYLKYVISRFDKDGVPTIFEVTSVKKEDKFDHSNNKIGEVYLTTFKFTYNDQFLEETITTRQNIPVGVRLRGKYLPTATINKISVAGEGFSIPKVVPRFLITLGLILLIILISILVHIHYYIVLVVMLILVLAFVIINKLSAKKQDK